MCKRNVPTHEVFAQKLAGNALLTLVEPLLFDMKEYPFKFFLLSDSTCGLCLFNPALNIKNMLLSNSIESTKDRLNQISRLFPKAIIYVGYIKGEANPSDVMSKLHLNAIDILNSKMYREGPEKYGTLQKLKQDWVATFQNGTFNFRGLSNELLGIHTVHDGKEEERCLSCQEPPELCGAAMTRAQKKADEKEEKEVKDGELRKPEVQD